MGDDQEHCNQEMLNRYVDRETSPEQMQRIELHLQSCTGCRQYVKLHGELAQRLKRVVSASRERVDFDELEQRIVSAARRRSDRWGHLREALFSWKLVLPVAATAAMALFFFTSLFQSPPPPGPSAIINSFTGRVSSVMILETPQSHHTVIWYSEEATEGNGADSKKL